MDHTVENKITDLFDGAVCDRIHETVAYISSLTVSGELHYNLFNQVLETALIVADEMLLREQSVTVALLYRYLQYDIIDEQTVRSKYGDAIADLAVDVIKLAKLDKGSISLQTDSFIHLVMTLSDDPRALLIIIAEQLNKMRSFKKLPEAICDRLLEEVQYLYAPIAHRLGLYTIKTEFEELWLKHSNYTIFRSIADQLEAKKHERETFINHFISPIKAKMKKYNITCEIKGRPKSIFSIWKKMQNQKVGVDGIYDKFAIRIIIETDDLSKEKELCWKVYSVVTENYRPFPRRLRDWISHPKSSGYESLHTTVQTDDGQWVEVQIRTRRMDDIAEKGCAAHWKYKESSAGNSSEDWLGQMRRALENPIELEKHRDNVKSTLYSKEVYVFTPNNEVKRLRAGATILDFAFSVHTTVGLRCTGGRVNGKFVPIKHELKTGDIVEVSTSKKQRPNREWLEFVSSPSAKAKIRRYIQELENEHSNSGREILRRKMKGLGIEANSVTMKQVAEFFGLDSIIDLYEAIGSQRVDILKVKDAFVKSEEPEVEEEIEEVTPVRSTPAQSRDTLIIDKNIDQIEYSLAKCCSPLRGDDIFGFITVNKGVSIHKSSCPNAHDLHLNHPNRIIEASWTDKEKGSFVTKLVVKGSESGSDLLHGISKIIKFEPHVSLVSLNLTADTTAASTIEISVEVDNKERVEGLISKIRGTEFVVDVYRL